MRADESRVGGVGAPRLVYAVLHRILRAQVAIGRREVHDRELRHAGLVHETEKVLREAELRWIVVDRQRRVIGEPGPSESQREHRVVARDPRVVDRENLRAPLEDVVVRVEEAVRVIEPRDVVRARLVGAVVQIEAGERRLVGELVLHLHAVQLLELVVDDRLRAEVRRAVVEVQERQREIAQHLLRDRIDPVLRNGVVGERQVRQRIVNSDRRRPGGGRRKIAVALSLRREHDAGRIARGDVVVVLRGEPEEGPVLHDRAAEPRTRRVPRRVLLPVQGDARGVIRRALLERFLAEVVVRGAPDGPRLEERRAVEVVRSRPQGRVEHAAARAPHFRVVGVHLHLHIVERFDRGVRDRAVGQVGDRHAVQRVVVAAACAAAERQQRGVGLILLAIELRVARRNDSGYRRADEKRGASGCRQRLQRLHVEHRALRGIRGLDQRRLAGDRDVLFDGADLEGQIEHDEGLRPDPDAGALDLLEPLQRRPHRVRPWIDAREHVLAAVVGDSGAIDVRLLVVERHFHTGHDAAGVLDRAAEAPLEALAGRVSRERHDERRRQSQRSPKPHDPPPSKPGGPQSRG